MQVRECPGVRRVGSAPAGTVVPRECPWQPSGCDPAWAAAFALGLVGDERSRPPGTEGRAGVSPRLCPAEKWSQDGKRGMKVQVSAIFASGEAPGRPAGCQGEGVEGALPCSGMVGPGAAFTSGLGSRESCSFREHETEGFYPSCVKPQPSLGCTPQGSA